LILVSVATERYLVTIHQQNYVALQFFNFCSHLSQHTTKEKDVSIVNASFHVTHWSVAPFGTGLSRVKNVGMTLNYMPTFKFQLFQITTFFSPERISVWWRSFTLFPWRRRVSYDSVVMVRATWTKVSIEYIFKFKKDPSRRFLVLVSWSTKEVMLFYKLALCGGWNWPVPNGLVDLSIGSIPCASDTSPLAATFVTTNIKISVSFLGNYIFKI
jgi:hypothetical protein